MKKFLRALPLLINLLMYFGLHMESSKHYFLYTIGYLLLGNWFIFMAGLYLFFVKDDSLGMWVMIAGAVMMVVGYSKDSKNSAKMQVAAGKSNKRSYTDNTDNDYYHDEVNSKRYDEDEPSFNRNNQDRFSSNSSTKNNSQNKDDEYWERKKAEDDAYYYRKNGGPRWKVDAADEALNRSQRDRDYEDEKYEMRCSGCNQPESQCRCCSDCDRYPCRCCSECGYANCRCCSDCGYANCRCCNECGYANCRCCNECGRASCRCCSDCGYANCRCCRECGYASCRCCYRCRSYPCSCDR